MQCLVKINNYRQHKMKTYFFILLLFPLRCISQDTINFSKLVFQNVVPSDLTSTRTATLVHLKTINADGVDLQADWKMFSEEVHGYLYKMGIDAVVYINLTDYLSSPSGKISFNNLLEQRGIDYLIFLNEKSSGYQLICTDFDPKDTFARGQAAYEIEKATLKSTLLSFAREVKRSNPVSSNFLIPERPFFADEIPIVENLTLKNYPGQVRRILLAVERFPGMPVTKNPDGGSMEDVEDYNRAIELKNRELASILEGLPYDVKFIDYMDDENLLRNKYQFVLRHVYASGRSLYSMLGYNGEGAGSGYISVIPVMPDNATIKNIPKDALVYKFFIRQNIIKNLYVGKWDADVTWQKALKNYINNMTQYFNR